MTEETNPVVWAVRQGYRFEPVAIIKETDKMVTYDDMGRARRVSKANQVALGFRSGGVLPWRGSEADARLLAQRLDSVFAEMSKRRREAAEYAERECAKLLSAQP